MKRKFTPSVLSLAFLIAFAFSFIHQSMAQVPRPDHVVICIMENHPYASLLSSNEIITNPSAPHINALAFDSGSANFTSSHAIEHPSQPNYLDFFSGGNQGITSDSRPSSFFTTPNLARELMDSSLTFVTYSEDMPYMGFDNDTLSYKRKHNPVTNWVGSGTNQVPATTNQPFTAFPSPTGYDSLPTVCYVVPNQDNDMHNGSDPARIGVGDTWFYDHMNSYIQWAKTHNSLFILTWDEDDGTSTTFDNRIVTIFSGQMVKTGQYSENINHYTVLRTIEDMYGLGHAGQAANKSPIVDCWKTIISGTDKVNENKTAWRVYPNPVSSVLNFEGNGKGDAVAEISITDATGRMIARYSTSESENLRVNTSSFAAGMYFYHILNSNHSVQSGKFIAE